MLLKPWERRPGADSLEEGSCGSAEGLRCGVMFIGNSGKGALGQASVREYSLLDCEYRSAKTPGRPGTWERPPFEIDFYAVLTEADYVDRGRLTEPTDHARGTLPT